MKSRKLTDKQERFVKEYLVDLNATQAAIRAGYSKKNADVIGPELLGKTWVREAIQKNQAKTAQKLDIKKEDLIRDLVEIRERCMLGRPVRDREGNETGEWQFDANAAIKSISETNKMLGFYAPAKHEIDVDSKLHDFLLEMING